MWHTAWQPNSNWTRWQGWELILVQAVRVKCQRKSAVSQDRQGYHTQVNVQIVRWAACFTAHFFSSSSSRSSQSHTVSQSVGQSISKSRIWSAQSARNKGKITEEKRGLVHLTLQFNCTHLPAQFAVTGGTQSNDKLSVCHWFARLLEATENATRRKEWK